MKLAKRTTIENEIVCAYINTIIKSRKAQKGLKIAYLPLVHILQTGNGYRCSELAKLYSVGYVAMFRRLKRAQRAGMVRKDKFIYLPTDKGKLIAETISKNFAPHLERIRGMLLEDIKKHL